jgi:site-specific recombinase XerD
VFYGKGDTRISYSTARAHFFNYVNEAGLAHKGYTVHCLRHTFASELLNAGLRLEVLQQLLGHQDIEMTRRYARLTDRTREEEYFRAMAMIEKGDSDGEY